MKNERGNKKTKDAREKKTGNAEKDNRSENTDTGRRQEVTNLQKYWKRRR